MYPCIHLELSSWHVITANPCKHPQTPKTVIIPRERYQLTPIPRFSCDCGRYSYFSVAHTFRNPLTAPTSLRTLVSDPKRPENFYRELLAACLPNNHRQLFPSADQARVHVSSQRLSHFVLLSRQAPVLFVQEPSVETTRPRAGICERKVCLLQIDRRICYIGSKF